jgi:hypothetical protein
MGGRNAHREAKKNLGRLALLGFSSVYHDSIALLSNPLLCDCPFFPKPKPENRQLSLALGSSFMKASLSHKTLVK